MIPFDLLGLTPGPDGSLRDQAAECLAGLVDRSEEVLSLTFFVDARDAAAYRESRRAAVSAVREAFGTDRPPVAVIGQAPGGGRRVVLEAAVLATPANGVDVAHREVEGVSYTVLACAGIRQVHTGGLHSLHDELATAEQAKDAFAIMGSILAREKMDYGNVVRQWNYVEGVLEEGAACAAGSQGYQAFNDVRTIAYGRSAFPAGYPAATGIGQASGGVVLAFIALDAPPDVRVEPVSNPQQIDAHRYSDGVLVGEPLAGLEEKTSPKFERGKLVARGGDEIVFVSGTASILGEESVGLGDVEAQTRTTIENISALVPDGRLSYLRAYVKRTGDIPRVRRICEEAYGGIPALYVTADVCRDELLVEIEGQLRVEAPEDEA